jgi:hypothetical protein
MTKPGLQKDSIDDDHNARHACGNDSKRSDGTARDQSPNSQSYRQSASAD